MDTTEYDLAVRAAWLSYVGGYTQMQIAERLEVSRMKVHRLIASAHEAGLVKVFVEGEPARLIALEDALIERFGLNYCAVVPTLHDTPEGDFTALGAAAARYLQTRLEQGGIGILGVGWGRTLAEMARLLPGTPRPALRLVSIMGSLTRKAAVNPFDVVHRLTDATGSEGYFLPVPFIADSIADKRVLMSQKSVRDILALAHQADLCMVGIGAVTSSGHMHLQDIGQITAREYDDLRAAGAVADIIGQFIDEHGRRVASEVNDRSIGLSLEELRGRQVVAAAGGQHKATAILGTLRSGVLTGLITDENTAAQICRQVEGEHSELALDNG